MSSYKTLNVTEETKMKIIINNIAKILKADIEIKGISVIAGLNNTGKSTILKGIYSGVNIFRNAGSKITRERMRSLHSIIRRQENYFDDNGYDMLPKSLLEDFNLSISNNLSKFIKNPDDFNYFKKIFHDSLEMYDDFIREINKTHIYTDEFLKPIYDSVKNVFLRSKEEYLKYIGNMYISGTFNSQLNNIQTMGNARIEIDSANGHNFIIISDNKIKDMTYGNINEPDAIYLPSYNLLDRINARYVKMNDYSPEADIRRFLSDNEKKEQTFEDYAEINENLETIKEILHEVARGTLVQTASGSIMYKDNETDSLISISNAASGIKPFLIIQSLVEHGRLRKNSILLIDEPETNLHPEWHLIFAEVLILMYKYMGVFSVVNSHSPYFIRALEVKMADHGLMKKGTYYLMRKDGTNMFVTENVTNNTNSIYSLLYKPLEYL